MLYMSNHSFECRWTRHNSHQVGSPRKKVFRGVVPVSWSHTWRLMELKNYNVQPRQVSTRTTNCLHDAALRQTENRRATRGRFLSIVRSERRLPRVSVCSEERVITPPTSFVYAPSKPRSRCTSHASPTNPEGAKDTISWYIRLQSHKYL
jgi:hypothetical protein